MDAAPPERETPPAKSANKTANEIPAPKIDFHRKLFLQMNLMEPQNQSNQSLTKEGSKKVALLVICCDSSV